ncbi:MAG: hypothetical protein CMQ43_11160 [Gammaproteobacteria bacterium]|nr:hypothetical protein [Gammaproteobacteria bacterium]
MLKTLLRRAAVALAILAAVGTVALWYVVHDIPDALTRGPWPPQPVLIDDVRVVSMVPEAPPVQAGRAVLIENGTISQVGPAGSVAPPPGARVIRGTGRTLLPGLIDAHVHLNDEAELAGYLAHGVTGIRNMSGYPFHVDLAIRLVSGDLLGPDFVTTGRILNSPGPNESVLQHLVTTADEARAAVRAQYRAGFRTIKVYSNLRREPYEAILDEAASLGMAVTGHTPEGVRSAGVPRERPFDIPWEASLGHGFTTLEHVETLVWHGLRDDLDLARMGDLAARLARSGEPVTPTLIAHRRLVLIAESGGAYLDRPGSETINPFVRFVEQGAEAWWSGMDPAAYERPHTDFFVAATGLLHQAGVPLLAGTDAGGFGIIPGASLARELELLVEAGLTPHDALASATRIGAEVLGFDDAGRVAPGYRANLTLLPDDPLQDVGAVEHPAGVMIRGEWLDADRLARLRAAAAETSFVRSLWRALRMLAAP